MSIHLSPVRWIATQSHRKGALNVHSNPEALHSKTRALLQSCKGAPLLFLTRARTYRYALLQTYQIRKADMVGPVVKETATDLPGSILCACLFTTGRHGENVDQHTVRCLPDPVAIKHIVIGARLHPILDTSTFIGSGWNIRRDMQYILPSARPIIEHLFRDFTFNIL